MDNFELIGNLGSREMETREQEDKQTKGLGKSFSNPQPLISCQDAATSKRQLLLYLIPVIGFFPSLWTLYRRQSSREQLIVSRLSITLAFTWVLGYFLLATGAETSAFFTLRLLILNSFLTSSYFLVSVWLMFRIIQGKSNRLPGFSNFAERMLGKYLP
jgi:hypothetical protein